MSKLLVLRVGFMEKYSGPDIIKNGGAYVKQNQVGGEVFNFKPSRGKCYGYAMSRHWSGVNLEYFASGVSWEKDDEMTGVDVVFIAKRPGHGQVVVGWYRNATVFHKQYRVRRGQIPGMQQNERYFLCTVDAINAHLLPEEERTFDVPYAPAGNRGFPGQSNVWYPKLNSDNENVTKFVNKLKKFMASKASVPLSEDEFQKPPKTSKGQKGGRSGKPDRAHNLAVETASVDFVIEHYKSQGYKVESVETDNLGWDLELVKGNKEIYVEVKGVSASIIYFELTPNEYKKLKAHFAKYRICVVCDALTDPLMYELFPEQAGSKWVLRSQDGSISVPLQEKTAAIGVEVKKS